MDRIREFRPRNYSIGNDHHSYPKKETEETALVAYTPPKKNVSIYETYQENGQKKYGGPPKGWTGPPPPKGTEVFVSKIPKECMEDEIIPVFERIGTVYCMRLMMDFSGFNRGFCFIQYTSVADARTAIKQVNGHEIRPKRKINVVRSINNCRLFVGHIPKSLTRETIETVLKKYTDGITEVILYLSPTDKSLNRGFCFVEFIDHRSAAMARRNLINSGISDWQSDLLIDWAIPEREVDPEIMEKVCVTIMYVRNLMLKTTEKTIKEALNSFVEPSSILRVRKVKDFAFIHFRTREIAQTAINKFNGFILEGAELEATWAKPVLDRNQQTVPFSLGNQFDYNGNNCMDLMPAWNDPQMRSSSNGWTPLLNPWPRLQSAIPALTYGNDRSNTEHWELDSCINPGVNDNFTALKKVSLEYLKHYSPSLALEYVAIAMKWGSVVFGLSEIPCGSSYCYIAQISIAQQNNSLTYPELYHSPARTPQQAKDLVSEVFFRRYIL